MALKPLRSCILLSSFSSSSIIAHFCFSSQLYIRPRSTFCNGQREDNYCLYKSPLFLLRKQPRLCDPFPNPWEPSRINKRCAHTKRKRLVSINESQRTEWRIISLYEMLHAVTSIRGRILFFK
ncbi:hypothetical protein BX666DRAFT_1367932 [Dichotomocladium elegans]|nr:hypothetical protein BX666DRAFT_1367932 [Dichotomocladium elegans]